MDAPAGGRRDHEDPRDWPEGASLEEGTYTEVACGACGQPWRVHMDLAGYRLRCVCTAWVQVPLVESPEDIEQPLVALLGEARAAAAVSPVKAADGAVIEGSLVGPREHLRHASVRERQRFTNRAILELSLFMLAFLAPSLLLFFMTTGKTRLVGMPLAGVASSVLVLGVAWISGSFAFAGLRRPRARYVVEGILAAAVAFGLALAWQSYLQWRMPGLETDGLFSEVAEAIGLPMLIFAIGVVPGIFEELAFRGVLQGRLEVLLGAREGVIVTGMAFAMAHGITLAFPIHAALGLYLCWLRYRSKSLLPGMALHFLYNSALVLTDSV